MANKRYEAKSAAMLVLASLAYFTQCGFTYKTTKDKCLGGLDQNYSFRHHMPAQFEPKKAFCNMSNWCASKKLANPYILWSFNKKANE